MKDKLPIGGYREYTSLEKSEIGLNPPKSPLKRGTKIRILAPFLRGFGGFRSQNEVQQTCAYTVSIGLGIIMSLGIGISLISIHQTPAIAQQLTQKKKILPPPPPPSRGVPGNRTVSASMSGNCDLNLIALAPQFTATTPGKTTERSVWGQTIAQHPTFWFFIPATSTSTQLEFSLQNSQEEDIYRTRVSTPQQPGIIGIQIPTSQQSLQLDRNYHWTLKAKVACGTSTPNRVYVDGWVTRVNLPEATQQTNRDSYAQKGIWYDAVTSLARQRLTKPNDVRLQQDWIELLESGNLETIIKQPLLKL